MSRGAVLFDMDGTLIDTPNGIVRVYRMVLAELGLPEPDEAVVRSTIGRPLVAALGTLLGLPGDDERVAAAVARFRALFTEHVVPGAGELVFPGVADLLGALRRDGVPIAVVTSKVRRSAVEMLEAAGLLAEFDAVVCHGMAERGKPHPDLALLAAAELGVDPAGCVVVGDAVDDVLMAVSAGMTAVGVDFGVATADELRAAGADRVVSDCAGLDRILDDLVGREQPVQS